MITNINTSTPNINFLEEQYKENPTNQFSRFKSKTSTERQPLINDLKHNKKRKYRRLNFTSKQEGSSYFLLRKNPKNTGFKLQLFGSNSDKKVSSSISQIKKRRLSKLNKRPDISYEVNHNKLPMQKVMIIDGTLYPIEVLGEGNFHKVYKFVNKKWITFNKTTVAAENVILKIVHPNKTLKTKHIIEEDIKSYALLKENNICIPKIHCSPQNFIDLKNAKNGNFFIIEKAVDLASTDNWKDKKKRFNDLTKQDKDYLKYAKGVFEKTVRVQKEIINDFYPRNMVVGGGWTEKEGK